MAIQFLLHRLLAPMIEQVQSKEMKRDPALLILGYYVADTRKDKDWALEVLLAILVVEELDTFLVVPLAIPLVEELDTLLVLLAIPVVEELDTFL
ncbi:MAG TPA: hypothetical protein VLK78_00615, partial [Candidatus Angelobacter sp.]|nr:hypothetical protein [Candidatus Angelobacter sp.]